MKNVSFHKSPAEKKSRNTTYKKSSLQWDLFSVFSNIVLYFTWGIDPLSEMLKEFYLGNLELSICVAFFCQFLTLSNSEQEVLNSLLNIELDR